METYQKGDKVVIDWYGTPIVMEYVERWTESKEPYLKGFHHTVFYQDNVTYNCIVSDNEILGFYLESEGIN